MGDPASTHSSGSTPTLASDQTVTPDPNPPEVRPADPSEFERLRWIEFESDRLYLDVGIGPFAEDDSANHLPVAAAVFAVGDPAVGFVSLEIVDGVAHVDQVSVLPDHGRQGLGRALLEAAVGWAAASGYAALTLTTFRDVPWNAPFYSTLGFEEMNELSPGLAAIRSHEQEAGLDDFGPRLAMRRVL
jgi:GNAT superfamily N-acetyltransferase